MKRLAALSLCVLAAVPVLSIAQTTDVTLYGRINFVENWDEEGSFATKAAVSQGAASDGTTYRIFYSQKVTGEPSQVRAYNRPLGGGLAQLFEIPDAPVKRLEGFVGNGAAWMMGATMNYGQPDAYARFFGGSIIDQSTALFPAQPPSSGRPETNFDQRLTNAIRYQSPFMGVAALNGRNNVDNTFTPSVVGLRYDPEAGQVTQRYRFDVTQFPEIHTAFGQLDVAGWDGSRVAVGTRCKTNATSPDLACVFMLQLIGESNAVSSGAPQTTAALDTSFGGDGQVIIRAADPALPLRYFNHAFDAEERILVVYGLGRPNGTFVPTLLRLRRDGTLDTSFGSNGTVTIPTTGQTTNARVVTTDVHGNIVVTGETYTTTTVRPFIYFHYRTSVPGAPETYGTKLVEHTLPGRENSTFFRHIREPDGTITAVGATYGSYPNTATMRPLVVQMEGPQVALKAIEYFHANFGHYATIVNPEEAAKLDSGEIAGWARTNRFFWVYPLGTPGTVVVDRFFSQGFAKSSHVYTANAAESAKLKQSRDWLFEGPVFGAILPLMGKCPGVLRPVTRIYNNGLTGSPNHQFTDDPQAVAEGVATGGTPEGDGPAAAVYCTE